MHDSMHLIGTVDPSSQLLGDGPPRLVALSAPAQGFVYGHLHQTHDPLADAIHRDKIPLGSFYLWRDLGISENAALEQRIRGHRSGRFLLPLYWGALVSLPVGCSRKT